MWRKIGEFFAKIFCPVANRRLIAAIKFAEAGNKAISDKLSELDLLKKQAEVQINQALVLQKTANSVVSIRDSRAYTTLKAFRDDDADYLRKLGEIVEYPEYLYFMHRLVMTITAQLMDAGDEKAHYGVGILRGIDLVMKDLHAAKDKYRALMFIPAEESQDAV